MSGNPFATWFVATYAKVDSPVGDLANDLKGAPGLPRTGGLRELRGYLDQLGADEWAYDALDAGWKAYKVAPTCLSAGCKTKAAGGSSSYCPEHGGRSHQAGK